MAYDLRVWSLFNFSNPKCLKFSSINNLIQNLEMNSILSIASIEILVMAAPISMLLVNVVQCEGRSNELRLCGSYKHVCM